MSVSEPPRNESFGDRVQRLNEDRAGWLRGQLEAGETPVATDPHVLVTDRHIIFALRLHQARVANPDETREALRFDEISAWALGRLHDERPLLRLEHSPHVRVERMPAHRFLWFRWGNATGPVTHESSTLPFNHRRDVTLRAIIARLEADSIPRGEDFVVALKGTRQERGGYAVLYRQET